MRHSANILTAVAFLLALTACDATTEQRSAHLNELQDMEAIHSWNEKFSAAYNRGDWEAVLDFYTEDAVEMGPNKPSQNGRNAIGQRLQAAFQQYDFTINISSLEVQASGDWAFDRGTYVLSGKRKDGKSSSSKGKYLAILHRQLDGTWKRSHFIWNHSPMENPSGDGG